MMFSNSIHLPVNDNILFFFMLAPALSLPSQDTFQLYVYENGALVLGVITQLQEALLNLWEGLSNDLDNVAKGWPGCLRATATVSMLILEAQKLTLEKPLTVYTPMIYKAS
jgi:hypothetical protein